MDLSILANGDLQVHERQMVSKAGCCPFEFTVIVKITEEAIPSVRTLRIVHPNTNDIVNEAFISSQYTVEFSWVTWPMGGQACYYRLECTVPH